MSTRQSPTPFRSPNSHHPDESMAEPKPFDPFNQRRSSLFIERNDEGTGDGGRYRDDPSNETLTPPTSEHRRGASNDQGAGGYSYEKREEAGGFAARGTVPRSLREYRRELHADLWTRGGAFRTFGRFLFCTLFLGIFFLLSIVGALVLWARPPDVVLGTPGLRTGQTLIINTTTIDVPLELNISVNNPNYFSIDLTRLSVDLTYPTNSTPVGTGTISNVDFPSHTPTNFTFPFDVSIDYASSNDATADLNVLLDIAGRCGFLGGAKTQLSFDAEIKVDVKVFSVSVPVNVPYTINVDCPFDESDFESVLQGLEGSA